MSRAPVTGTLREWLETNAAIKTLRHLSRSIAGELGKKRGPIPFSEIPGGARPSMEELAAIVFSELTVFILENEERLGRFLAALPEDRWGAILETSFLRHLKDQRRRRGVNPFAYLQHRVSDIVRKTPGLHPLTLRFHGMTMATDAHAPLAAPTAEEDLAAVPVIGGVLDHIPADGTLPETSIVWLATYFLNQAAVLWEAPAVRVTVYDFLRWLFRLLPPEPLRTETFFGKEKDKESEDPLETQVPDPFGNPETCWFDRDKIARWAGQAALSFSQKEALVLVLRFDEGLTQAQVAKRLGKKGASAAHYQLKQIEMKLKTFMRDRPWLTPEDAHPEAFSLFFEVLVENLKNRFQMPSSRTKETIDP